MTNCRELLSRHFKMDLLVPYDEFAPKPIKLCREVRLCDVARFQCKVRLPKGSC